MRVRCFDAAIASASPACEGCWCCTKSAIENRAIGRLGGNVYFAHGFSGMGVALTGIAGKVIAETIAGTAERFDVFARLPHTTFHGGKLLRTPMLALAMLWYRLRDWM